MPRAMTPEEKFVRYYIQEGATEDALPKVAKRMRSTVAAVKRLLKKRAVQADIAERLAPVQLEQQRQELVGEAVVKATQDDKARIAELEAQLAAATTMPDLDLTEEMLDKELARLARLDAEKHGRVKLAAIQTGYVVKGITRQGHTERVAPTGNTMPQPGSSPFYQTLFDRLRLEGNPAQQGEPVAAPPAPEPPILEGEVFDLVPAPPATQPEAEETIPPPPPPRVPEAVRQRVRDLTERKADVLTIEVG